MDDTNSNMKLVELVEYLIKPQQLKKIYLEQGLTPESEALLVYMKRSLNIDSEITIFGIEETEDNRAKAQGKINGTRRNAVVNSNAIYLYNANESFQIKRQ